MVHLYTPTRGQIPGLATAGLCDQMADRAHQLTSSACYNSEVLEGGKGTGARKMQSISLFISPVDSSTGPGGQGT